LCTNKAVSRVLSAETVDAKQMTIKCSICDEEFKSNTGGQLTNHIKEQHDMSLEEYVIKDTFSGTAPVCKCGLCQDRPVFYRGKFMEFASGHRKFSVREKLYIHKFGTPKCVQCGSAVKFRRGEPLRTCSQKCAMVGKGFSNRETQIKISHVVRSRYGVDNVSRLDYVKEKISKANIGRQGPVCSDERKEASRDYAIVRWRDESYRKSVSALIKLASNSEKEKRRRSEAMLELRKDPGFCRKMWTGNKNRLSKVHSRIRKSLSLDDLGFKPEQMIGRRCVDDLHEGKKIIVESNGDYTHANPKLYPADFLVVLPGQSYTAGQKWEEDMKRTKELESLGYRVLVVWETDDLDVAKEKLTELMASDAN